MITSNCNITLRISPNEIGFDGTYYENDIEEIPLFGEIKLIKSLDKNNPTAQPYDATLGIKYHNEIDKSRTKISYNDRLFEIMNIKPSPVIYPDWKILELKEIFINKEVI